MENIYKTINLLIDPINGELVYNYVKDNNIDISIPEGFYYPFGITPEVPTVNGDFDTIHNQVIVTTNIKNTNPKVILHNDREYSSRSLIHSYNTDNMLLTYIYIQAIVYRLTQHCILDNGVNRVNLPIYLTTPEALNHRTIIGDIIDNNVKLLFDDDLENQLAQLNVRYPYNLISMVYNHMNGLLSINVLEHYLLYDVEGGI